MSMIKCPECGQDISDGAKYCVHCGSEFTVCPDCNTVHKGFVNICAVCGCVIKKEISKPEPTKKAEEDFKDLIEKKLDAEQRTFKRTDKILRWVDAISMAVMLVVSGLLVWIWTGKDILGKLATYNTFYGLGITAIIIFGVGGYIEANTKEIVTFFMNKKLKKFLSEKNLDYESYIRFYRVNGEEDMMIEFTKIRPLVAVAFSQKRPDGNRKLLAVTCSVFVLELIAVICLCTWMIQVYHSYMNAQLLDMSLFSWQWNSAAFIMGIVFLGLGILVDIVFDKKDKYYKEYVISLDTKK